MAINKMSFLNQEFKTVSKSHLPISMSSFPALDMHTHTHTHTQEIYSRSAVCVSDGLDPFTKVYVSHILECHLPRTITPANTNMPQSPRGFSVSTSTDASTRRGNGGVIFGMLTCVKCVYLWFIGSCFFSYVWIFLILPSTLTQTYFL